MSRGRSMSVIGEDVNRGNGKGEGIASTKTNN